MKRLLAHPSLVIGLAATLVFLALGLLSLVWTPYPIEQIDIPRRYLAPSAAHWLGTDNLGRDMLSLVMAGTWTSFLVAAVAVAIGVGLGVPLGLAAAAWGGAVEWLVLRLTDFVFAFPAVIVAILITTLVGPGAVNAIVAHRRRPAAAQSPGNHVPITPPGQSGRRLDAEAGTREAVGPESGPAVAEPEQSPGKRLDRTPESMCRVDSGAGCPSHQRLPDGPEDRVHRAVVLRARSRAGLVPAPFSLWLGHAD